MSIDVVLSEAKDLLATRTRTGPSLRSGRHLLVALLCATSQYAHAQDHGVAQLHALVNGLTVTPRVLLVGARPTDADADLIAWLARGHHIQTGYLSLTRGESAPNYTGLETGATLGAIHVQEMLAARAIDGGEQYFTRAYDGGPTRNVAETYRQWDHTILLGDVVAVVRAFRPHVIITRYRADTVDGDGQRQVSAMLAREVFDAALDTLRFSTKDYGMPWSPASVYEPGPGVSIDAGDFDRTLGRTFSAIAIDSRSQLRSFGFSSPPWQRPPSIQLRRVATRVTDPATAESASSLFAGIDTSFARLQRNVPPEGGHDSGRNLVTQMPGLLAWADSARAALDLQKPAAVIPYLKRVVELSSAARVLLRSCRHPARDAAASFSNTKCQPQWLDLDASLDLMQRRAGDALLIASGVTFETVADREFLASGDTALVTITIANNGDSPVSVNDVSVTNAIPVRMTEVVRIPAHASVQVVRSVTSMAYAHPWWVFKRENNFYPWSTTALDGVPRPAIFMRDFGIGGVAVPENIRRLSDVTVTLTMGMTTLTTSVGTVVYRTADPVLGVRDRPMSGVPAVTLTFERALEWAQAGKPLKKDVRVIVKSFSDKPQRLALKPASPGGIIRMESLPPLVALAPHEAREASFQLRGAAPAAMRYDLGLLGLAPPDTFEVGFRTAQYSYLPPLHFFRGTTVSVQVVDIEIPSRLSVAYVRGAGDDADVALKGLGVPVYVVNNEGLIRFDLDGISTVVIGPDALRTDPGLFMQVPRLTEFARKGGTVVILANADAVNQPGALPFPVRYAQPYADQVSREDAPVVTDATSRLMTWPNMIRDADWKNWVGPRAFAVPTTADARYARPIETHDPGQKDNRNTVLVATVGKGRIIYTSLTLTQQISNAVPGAMRLLINLLSAGLTGP